MFRIVTEVVLPFLRGHASPPHRAGV